MMGDDDTKTYICVPPSPFSCFFFFAFFRFSRFLCIILLTGREGNVNFVCHFQSFFSFFYPSCCSSSFDFMTFTLLWIPVVHTNSSTRTRTVLHSRTTVRRIFDIVCNAACSGSTTAIFLAIGALPPIKARRDHLRAQK